MDGIWFQKDVRRILLALAAAGCERGPEYHKALSDCAIAFGLVIGQPTATRSRDVVVYESTQA